MRIQDAGRAQGKELDPHAIDADFQIVGIGPAAVLALIAALQDNHLMDGRETRGFGRSSDFLGRVVLASLFPSNGEVALRTPGPEEPPGAAFDLRDRPGRG